jgi:hypothetical protein
MLRTEDRTVTMASLNGRILYLDRNSGDHVAPADPAWRVTA